MANPHHNHPSPPGYFSATLQKECWAALRAEWSSNCLETQWGKVCAVFIGVELFLLLVGFAVYAQPKNSWKRRFFWGFCRFCQSKNSWNFVEPDIFTSFEKANHVLNRKLPHDSNGFQCSRYLRASILGGPTSSLEFLSWPYRVDS